MAKSKLLIEIQTIGVSKSQRQLNGLKTQIASLEPPLERIRAKFAALQARMRLFSQGFSMWALGVMFFGMLIQRTFTNIATTGVKAFKDITDSSSLLTQNLSKLEAGWMFLKWSIGNAIATALLPLTPAIMSIILAVGEWINKNPELAGKLVILGIVVGGLLFLFGSLVLGLTAVAQAFAVMLTSPATLIFVGVGISVIALIALLSVLNNDVISLKDKMVSVFTLVSAAVFGVAIAFGAWPVAMLAGLALILGGLFLFWDEFGRLLGRGAIKWEIMALGMEIAVLDALSNALGFIEDFINSIPSGVRSLLGLGGYSTFLSVASDTLENMSDYRQGMVATRETALAGESIANGSVMDDFIDRFSELFAPGFADMSDQMTTALTSALPSSEDVTTTDSSALTVEGDVVFNVDPSDGLSTPEDYMAELAAEFARYT